jgi:hypothetical protein
MSDTPRTDSNFNDDGHYRYGGYVPTEFAQQLERELAEARDQLRLCNIDQFTTAAELAEAVAKERERCAKVCERVSIPYENTSSEAAAAIRKGE